MVSEVNERVSKTKGLPNTYFTDYYEGLEERAVSRSNDTCHGGSQFAGILFGFLVGLILDLLIGFETLTMFGLATASSFAYYGSQIENPLYVNRRKFSFLSIIIFLIAEFFGMWISIGDDDILSIFLLSILSTMLATCGTPLLNDSSDGSWDLPREVGVGVYTPIDISSNDNSHEV